jgi:hypothetical protein
VAEVESGQPVASHPVTLGELVERWLCDVTQHRTLHTMKEHRRLAKANVKPALGKIKVNRLTGRQIDGYSSLWSHNQSDCRTLLVTPQMRRVGGRDRGPSEGLTRVGGSRPSRGLWRREDRFSGLGDAVAHTDRRVFDVDLIGCEPLGMRSQLSARPAPGFRNSATLIGWQGSGCQHPRYRYACWRGPPEL